MNINNEPVLISVMIVLALFISIIAITVFFYENRNKNTRFGKENPEDWLFHNFNYKVYGAFFGEKDPDEVAIKLGIRIEQYHKNCLLTRTPLDVEKIVIYYIYGIVFFLVSVMFALLFNPIFLVFGILLFFCFTQYETENVKSKAEKMRSRVKAELPHFLDLLSTELEVGLSVDNAISILSLKYDSLLSKEFSESLNEVKLGASGWQLALEKVAAKYSIDTLSDFVLDITVAFNKGISVTQSVKQKTKDIKQKHLLDTKEKAGKTENTILIPIAVLEFIPMLVFILLPTLSSVSNF